MPSDAEQIAILGAGSWGTALAIHLAGVGHRVTLWARDAALALEIEAAAGGAAAPPLRPVSRDGDLPLSFAQQRLVVLRVVVLEVHRDRFAGELS